MLSRKEHIEQLMGRWHTTGMSHEPIHPHLAPDSKTFDDAYRFGRMLEELTRPLLEALFPRALIVSHCDTTLATRQAGKRVWIAGRDTILPDFEIYDETLSC